MNPAFSVIAFTLLAGCGQGLAVALSVGVLTGAVTAGSPFTGPALAASFALLAAGLASSFLHLGRPMLAWRAAAMWRTSWLSREVIALPVALALLALWGLLHRQGADGPWAATALPLAVLAISAVLWVCTGMIYACIRFIQEWAHPITLANYTLIGLSSGLLLATVLAGLVGDAALSRLFGAWALAFTVAACAGRALSLARNARLKPRSTLQSATGINARRLRQVSMGMTGGSFNTREFFHRASEQGLRHVKLVAILLGFVLPALLLAWGVASGSLLPCLAALALQAPGLIAERWFFFAQARHPQNLYYQRVS